MHSQAELDFLGHNLQKVGTRASPGLRAGDGQAPEQGKGPANPHLPSCPLAQFSRGQEQHWWIGLHTAESDGRFR